MKKTKLFSWAFIAAMTSFSACTNDAEEALTQESEIKLTSEITPSRVTSLDYQSTQIVEGQQIGVTITGAKSNHNNVAWTAGADGALNNTGDEVYYGNETATITAYHPFNDDWDESTTYAFSVSTDQSSDAGYLASDLLWATATSSKTENPVPLTFSHKLAKINVTLVPENEDDDLIGATISIYNTKTSTTFNPTTGAISAATGEPQDIIAGVTTDDAYTASAIVIPQEVSGKFIKITHEGKTYYYTLSSAKTLEAGTSYSYTLTVKGKQLINTGSSINPWNPDSEEGEEGDAEEENNTDGENNSGSKTVNNIIAGGLGSLLTQKEKETLTSLTITGKLNSDDIRLIREMAGGQFSLHTSPSSDGKLTVLDITNCKIVKGGSAFVQKDETTSYYTDDNSLGENTFAYTNLKEVYLPTSVIRLGDDMFAFTNISKLIIPDCVEEIKGYQFWDNDALISIDLPANLKSGYTGLFHGCKNLETITIEESNTRYKVIDGVLYLDEYILYCCPAGKTTVTVKDGTTCFTYESFSNSKISELTIPSSVVELASSIFRGCKNLIQIKMESSTPPRATEFSGNGTEHSAFNMFDNMENCKLLVPAGSKDEYSSAAGWKDFSNIEEYQE